MKEFLLAFAVAASALLPNAVNAEQAPPGPAGVGPPAAQEPASERPSGETGSEAPGGRRSEDVRYANGPLELAAELLLPAAEGPVPGAVILQGSGTSDRTNAWARAIAEALVGEGLAVLLTDKRGSGASGGDWRTAGFGDLAGDALAGLELLAARPEVDAARVGLVGLSQGGWVAPIAAAARPEEVAFVVNVSGAAVSFAEQTTVEMANTARQAGLDEAAVGRVLELHRLAAHYLLSGDWEAYEEALASAREQPWGALARGFPQSREQPIWTFLRRVASFDPLPYWLQVQQPVLVVYGGEDEGDNVPVAESVRRLEFAFAAARHPSFRIEVFPGAGHGLLDPGGEGLLPAFLDLLAGWLRQTVGSAGVSDNAS